MVEIVYEHWQIASFRPDFYPLMDKPLYKTVINTINSIPQGALAVRCSVCNRIVLSTELCANEAAIARCPLQSRPALALHVWEHRV